MFAAVCLLVCFHIVLLPTLFSRHGRCTCLMRVVCNVRGACAACKACNAYGAFRRRYLFGLARRLLLLSDVVWRKRIGVHAARVWLDWGHSMAHVRPPLPAVHQFALAHCLRSFAVAKGKRDVDVFGGSGPALVRMRGLRKRQMQARTCPRRCVAFGRVSFRIGNCNPFMAGGAVMLFFYGLMRCNVAAQQSA